MKLTGKPVYRQRSAQCTRQSVYRYLLRCRVMTEFTRFYNDFDKRLQCLLERCALRLLYRL